MKKVLAILFAVSLCISSLYTVAFAEEEKSNEMIPVPYLKAGTLPAVGPGRMMAQTLLRHGLASSLNLWMMGGITLMFHALCRTSLSMPVRPLSRRKALR